MHQSCRIFCVMQYLCDPCVYSFGCIFKLLVFYPFMRTEFDFNVCAMSEESQQAPFSQMQSFSALSLLLQQFKNRSKSYMGQTNTKPFCQQGFNMYSIQIFDWLMVYSTVPLRYCSKLSSAQQQFSSKFEVLDTFNAISMTAIV